MLSNFSHFQGLLWSPFFSLFLFPSPLSPSLSPQVQCSLSLYISQHQVVAVSMETHITARPQMIWTGECMVRMCVCVCIFLSKEDYYHHFVGRTKWQCRVGLFKATQASAPLSFFMKTHIRTHTRDCTHTHTCTEHRGILHVALGAQRLPAVALIHGPQTSCQFTSSSSPPPFGSLSPFDLHSSPLYFHPSLLLSPLPSCLSPLSSFLILSCPF